MVDRDEHKQIPEQQYTQAQKEQMTTPAVEVRPVPVAETTVEQTHHKETTDQEAQPSRLEESIDSMRKTLRIPKKQKPTKIPQVRDEVTTQIEKIMEDGLKEAFVELPPVAREEFKIKGEQTAFEIRSLLQATHIKVKKILRLIIEWLKMLPGINRFFLEQEAKIKTDKIIALKQRVK